MMVMEIETIEDRQEDERNYDHSCKSVRHRSSSLSPCRTCSWGRPSSHGNWEGPCSSREDPERTSLPHDHKRALHELLWDLKCDNVSGRLWLECWDRRWSGLGTQEPGSWLWRGNKTKTIERCRPSRWQCWWAECTWHRVSVHLPTIHIDGMYTSLGEETLWSRKEGVSGLSLMQCMLSLRKRARNLP